MNAGFTCPNIDGTKGYGGCIYCSKSGSGEFGGNPSKSLVEQFNDVKEVLAKNGLMLSILLIFKLELILMLLFLY